MTQTTPENSEYISIIIKYKNDADGASLEYLTHTVEFSHVPSQTKLWDRAKEMIDILYEQVR